MHSASPHRSTTSACNYGLTCARMRIRMLRCMPLAEGLSWLRCSERAAEPGFARLVHPRLAYLIGGANRWPGWCLPCDMPKPTCALDAADVSRVIEMAWEDRTPFEAIKTQFGLDEAAVIVLMRQQLKPGSFRLWRDRVQDRKTKHAATRPVSLQGSHRHHARHRTPQR